MTILSDIYELWKFFDKFNQSQVIGLVDNQSNYYLKNNNYKPWPAIGKGYNTGVILYDMKKIKKVNWYNLWSNVTKRMTSIYGATKLGDQDIINALLTENSNLLYQLPCFWNTQLSDHSLSVECYEKHKPKIIHWNSPKKYNVINENGDYFRSLTKTFIEYNGNLLRKSLKKCGPSHDIANENADETCHEFNKPSNIYRTLLYFQEYKYESVQNDVTLVVQLSYDRLQKIEEVSKYWNGPISLAIYVTDQELHKCIDFIKKSNVLSERLNIGYHAVYKQGEYYPINTLRNTGLKNVNTPYVFLTDIDFLPMKNLYEHLVAQLTASKNMRKKALIIPAFETKSFNVKIPKNKSQLVYLWEREKVMPFLQKVWSVGHAATNFEKWKTTDDSYKVNWEQDFEPYIVVSSHVTKYDERFMGFGWNKVSHIMELKAQNYDFIVLPNVFIIHKPHSQSYDFSRFSEDPTYRLCLQILKEEFIKNLNLKYDCNFELKNFTVTYSPMSYRRKRKIQLTQTTEENNTDYPFNMQ